MKKISLLTIYLSLALSVFGSPPTQKKPTTTTITNISKTVVWAGIDYSLAKMIGNNNKFEYGFNVPDLIFPGMLEQWNKLFLDERIQRISTSLGRRILIDIASVTERNKTANEKQIVIDSSNKETIKETHISQETIESEVQSYKMMNTNGLGIVFIVDRLVYGVYATTSGKTSLSISAAEGAVFVVFFDVGTRQVISIKRKTSSTSNASNFRNFWFGPIKDADSTLKLPK